MDAATLLSGSTPASEAPRLWRRLVTLAASGLLLGLCAFTHGLVTHSLYAPPPASNTLASRTQSRGLAAPPPSTWAVPSNTRPSAAERIARAPNPSPRSGKLHLSEEQGPLWSTRVWLVLMVTTAALGLSWVLRWAQQRTFERRRPWPMECAAVMAPESHGIALFAATGAPHPGTRAPVIGVVGGGPAGFFAAIRAAQLCKGQAKVVVYEAGSDKLRKVRKSGGGRCNVMHDPFDPDKTVRRITRGDQNVDPTEPFNPAYPRGGPLLCNLMSSTFGPKDMYEWFTGTQDTQHGREGGRRGGGREGGREEGREGDCWVTVCGSSHRICPRTLRCRQNSPGEGSLTPTVCHSCGCSASSTGAMLSMPCGYRMVHMADIALLKVFGRMEQCIAGNGSTVHALLRVVHARGGAPLWQRAHYCLRGERGRVLHRDGEACKGSAIFLRTDFCVMVEGPSCP